MAEKTILLVDDDDVFVEAVSAVLESQYRVRRAANGTEGLQMIAEELPDLVILDVMMDFLSEGFEVARKLRNDSATADLPIIMLTGVDQVYNVRMEVDESWVPCERYLEKPVAPGDLLRHIAEVLEARPET
ncbi:MAG: response regulator [Acidobacteria bacterium]|nr:MAG: response regulator [Acidobacteriota bacterium]